MKKKNAYKGSCNHRIQISARDDLAADLLIYQLTYVFIVRSSSFKT